MYLIFDISGNKLYSLNLKLGIFLLVDRRDKSISFKEINDKGLNYAVVPTAEIIVAMEYAVRGLPHEIADEIHHDVAATLKR